MHRYGNYCGLGNKIGTEPIDKIDKCCSKHDDCWQEADE